MENAFHSPGPSQSDASCAPGAHGFEVADHTLMYRRAYSDDATPTGEQLALAAGYRSAEAVTVLKVLANGDLQDIRPLETVDLSCGTQRFIMGESDRTYRLTIDGRRLDWPFRQVSGAALRILGRVPAEHELYFERREQADHLLALEDLVDLNGSDIESFVSRKPVWLLNINGIEYEFPVPDVPVRDALTRAGFDLTGCWHLYLKFKGRPKQELELGDVIDLRPKGIERLRVTPKKVHNGQGLQCAFALLPEDEAYLNRLKLDWENLEEGNRRWLLIHDYSVPEGYKVPKVKLALEIPPTYPAAPIYGFYVSPPLELLSGRVIEATQMRGTLRGTEFHGWSRNRGPDVPWNPVVDRVHTQLALVEAALAKEIDA